MKAPPHQRKPNSKMIETIGHTIQESTHTGFAPGAIAEKELFHMGLHFSNSRSDTLAHVWDCFGPSFLNFCWGVVVKQHVKTTARLKGKPKVS